MKSSSETMKPPSDFVRASAARSLLSCRSDGDDDEEEEVLNSNSSSSSDS